MFKDTGDLSFYLGIAFILISVIGIGMVYFLLIKDSVDKEKLNTIVDLGKWFIVSVAIVLSTSIVNDGFREREQDIKEITVFDKYVTVVTKTEGIEERWLLSEYFATVSPPGPLQESWERYLQKIEPTYTEFRKNKRQIDSLENLENPPELIQNRLNNLRKKNQALDKGLVVSTSTNEWIIVAGADGSLEQANFEVERIKKLHYSALVYKKGNKFRTVVGPFIEYSQSLSSLADIKGKINQGAYIVNLKTWCVNSESKLNYIECK